MARFLIIFDYKTIIYNKSVLNILCVTQFLTSSFAVFEAAIRVKSTHLIKSCMKTRNKRENVEIKRNVYINLHLKDRVDTEFTGC